MIISLGYRVKYGIATSFRRWATERLKGSCGASRRKEFLGRIRDIRFDLAEISALEHRPMYMADYVAQMDAILFSGN